MRTLNYLSGASRGPLSIKVLLFNSFTEAGRNFCLSCASHSKNVDKAAKGRFQYQPLSCLQRIRRIVVACLLVLPLINIITLLVLRRLEITKKKCGSPRPTTSKLPLSRFGLNGVFVQGSQFPAQTKGHPIGAVSNGSHLKIVIPQKNHATAWATTLAMLWGDAQLRLFPSSDVKLDQWTKCLAPRLQKIILARKKQSQRLENLFTTLTVDLLADTTITDMRSMAERAKELKLTFEFKQLALDGLDSSLRLLIKSKNPIVALVKEEHDTEARPVIIDKYIAVDSVAREAPYNSQSDTFMVRFPETGCVHYVGRRELLAGIQGTEVVQFKKTL